MDQPEQRYPRQAQPVRRLLQTIVALVGWVVFVYWWWIVFGRVSRKEVVFTGVFIAVATVIMILVTGLWSLHNKRLYRRKQARNKARPVHEDFSRDILLRSVQFVGGVERARRDPLVRVRIVADAKTYQAWSGRGPASGEGPVQGQKERGPAPGHA